MRLAVAAAVLAIAGSARADDDRPEHMLFVESGTVLTVSTEPGKGIGSKLFDARAYEALKSGIPSTVLIRVQITPVDSDTPVAEQLILRRAVYDVWDETYTIQLDEPGGAKRFKVKPQAEVFTSLTAINALPVAPLDALPIGKIFVLKMVVELNPVSKETLAQVRRWLSQGNAGGLDRGGGFFGSFVSLFYNPKIADADRMLRLRSQPFYRPPP